MTMKKSVIEAMKKLGQKASNKSLVFGLFDPKMPEGIKRAEKKPENPRSKN